MYFADETEDEIEHTQAMLRRRGYSYEEIEMMMEND